LVDINQVDKTIDLTKGPWNYLNLPTEKHFPAHAIRSMNHVKERGQQWG
jgi:hypothetical protein